MTYMDALTGATRTNAPVVKVATIADRRSGQRVAAAMERRDDDSRDFRTVRAVMSQRYGVCG